MTDPSVHHLPRLGLAAAMRRYGLTARALHYYEELGLIEARRDRRNTRYYDSAARRRLDWIAPLRRAGVTLEEIRDVLHAEDQEGRGQEHARRAIARRQEALEAQLGQANDALEALPGPGRQLAVEPIDPLPCIGLTTCDLQQGRRRGRRRELPRSS